MTRILWLLRGTSVEYVRPPDAAATLRDLTDLAHHGAIRHVLPVLPFGTAWMVWTCSGPVTIADDEADLLIAQAAQAGAWQ
jgi:hypothetical protein